ncbi:hypothetical protein TTHERM_001346845 (macronuclear) [Tetrahymena thermophila SB210]|uniref:Uncharacterized protein n=1 Tax=Tetrahymena thermophila (strain SB210) TaxID=312017 RepID=W7XFX6_TETTS|nr:hypothetical protein TTHERM_001346845 [Tetrahymena thermophila SB210]EWS72936.1 hypothetical protein TTHERM_001346845 [Tetrahymena thermophila SB210]|eukprot:XP_012654531.1 hypothetical protein TTHERM_001346845 [Tetrahymena thermophila SB210]
MIINQYQYNLLIKGIRDQFILQCLINHKQLIIQISQKQTKLTMKIQKIRTFLLVILQILKYLYADQYRDCTQGNVNYGLFNPKFSYCIINQRSSFIQSDIDSIKQYFSNMNCLNLMKFPLFSGNYLTGNSCTSNSDIIIQYTPQSTQQKL